MSRIGKKPILIPAGVKLKVEKGKIIVKGPKGELSQELQPSVRVEERDGKIFVDIEPEAIKKEKGRGKQFDRLKAFWGLTRAIIANMVKGVTEGYEKKMEMVGIGYRAKLDGGDLVLEVGFSHPVKVRCPLQINFALEKNIITVSGIDKQLVGEIAATIRRVRPPEPYKGKGIKYIDEVVRRKAGKKAVGAGV